MSESTLHISGRKIQLHGCMTEPDFRSLRVLCSDPWDFVSLWLKKNHHDDAIVYWEQARSFYEASSELSYESSPLTSYYCFLNATKALLSSKKQPFSYLHGVAGYSKPGHASLANEIVKFHGSGILPSLCKFLKEPINDRKEFSLSEIFWHLPFIHRAYCLTFKGTTELFIPLLNNCFVRRDGSKEAWFKAEIDKRYINAHTKKIIRPGFELHFDGNRYIIRRKRRFKWSGRDLDSSIEQFTTYHRQIRHRIMPIYSSENHWYLKKSVAYYDRISNSQLVLIYASMHRLSELSRYDPISFAKHFNVNHNWLLSEFIQHSPAQFIYGIASEITGLEFLQPDAF